MRCNVRPLFFIPLLFCSGVYAATRHRASIRNYVSDVDELTRTLLSPHDDPFAEDDKWSALSDDTRLRWTSSNQQFDITAGASQIIKTTKQLRSSSMSIHIDVQVVAPNHFISVQLQNEINRLASVMTVHQNGTALTFSVSQAPQTMYNRISMHSSIASPDEFATLLEQSAPATGAVNVIYAILNLEDRPVNNYVAPIPFVGRSRTAWFMYNVEKGLPLNVPKFLVAVEKAAAHVFAPIPLYYPIPLIKEIRVEVIAYTPNHHHRALWLEDFAWDQFEATVRASALPGQMIRFFSSQVNSDCPQCARAFGDLSKLSRESLTKAAIALNNDVPPNHNWSRGSEGTGLKKKLPQDTFRLYVLDIAQLRRGEAPPRIGRWGTKYFPGMGIITIRSSDTDTRTNLRLQMLRAVVAGVYGIANPDLYIPNTDGQGSVLNHDHPSPVLQDICIRSLVRSVVEKRISELEEIIEGILYFDVDPAASLGEGENRNLMQRINVMTFKLRWAQQTLSNSNDGARALYAVKSALHDLKAVRIAFDITGDTSTFERFRDPTLRCHFSRLKREALKASQILETTYPAVMRMIYASTSFSLSFLLANVLLGKISEKTAGKRE